MLLNWLHGQEVWHGVIENISVGIRLLYAVTISGLVDGSYICTEVDRSELVLWLNRSVATAGVNTVCDWCLTTSACMPCAGSCHHVRLHGLPGGAG